MLYMKLTLDLLTYVACLFTRAYVKSDSFPKSFDRVISNILYEHSLKSKSGKHREGHRQGSFHSYVTQLEALAGPSSFELFRANGWLKVAPESFEIDIRTDPRAI